MSMSHEFCKRRCRSLPLRLLHALECFSRVTKRHRGQETMVCVIWSLKWRFCTQSRLIFAFLYPIAVFHHVQPSYFTQNQKKYSPASCCLRRLIFGFFFFVLFFFVSNEAPPEMPNFKRRSQNDDGRRKKSKISYL